MYPDSSRCYFERGGAYYFAGKLEEAYIDLDDFVHMEPKNPEGYYWRGMVLSDSRVYVEAEVDYLKAIELGKSDGVIKFKLAEAYLFQDKYDQSEELLFELIKSDPERASTYNLLGLLHEDKKNYTQSIDYFTKGISIDKNYVSLYYNRARVNAEVGNKDAACEDWTVALRLGAMDSEIWLDANNCTGLKGLTATDQAFDEQERAKGKGKAPKRNITPDYLPFRRHARYTYTSQFEGEMDTAAMVVLYDDPHSNDFYFDIWNDRFSDIDLLYFEILHARDFRYSKDNLELLMLGQNSEIITTPLFPREFTLGKEITIENTWNPKAIYDMKEAVLSLEGIENVKMPNGKTVECVKLRIEMKMNNGRSDLSYLWLVKDFGMVKWRNSEGRTWELIRYAVPEYGSFPPEENKHLLPPPEDVTIPK